MTHLHIGIKVALVTAAALALASCAAKKEHAAPASPPEPAPDGSSQVNIYSAARPQRNHEPELGKGDAPSLVQAVNDCHVAVCIGSASDALIEAIRERAAQARRCYESALSKNATLAGRVLLDLRIAHDGSSCPLGIAENELHESQTLVPCLRDLLETRYPRPTGGCVELKLPLRFVPEYIEADAGAPSAAPPGAKR